MTATAAPISPLPPIPANEAARIEALHRTGILDTPAEQEYDDLVRLAAAICGTPMSLISLVDSNRQWFKAKVGIARNEAGRDVAFCAHVVAQDDLFVVGDATQDDRFKNNPFVTGDPNIRFYAGMPLTTEAGLHVGSLCVLDSVPRMLTDIQEQALAVLSRQVMLHLKLREESEASRRAEAAALMSEAKFRRTIEHLADGVCIIDAFRGCFVDANSAMLEMLGYTHKEFCALSPFDIVAGETMEQFIENIGIMHGTLHETGMCDVGRKQYRRKDGRVITVNIRVSHVPDEYGGMNAVVVRDVTEEDRIQTERHAMESSLRRSEEKFRRVVEGLSEGVLLVDLASMTVAEANSTFLKLSASTQAEVVGRGFYELVDIDEVVMQREMARIVEQGQVRIGRKSMRRSDGSRVEVDIALSFVSGHESRSMVCVLRDVTEQRAYEDQLFNYQSSLEEANGKLRAMATTDALTGTRNRAAFDARMAEEHERSVRHGHPVSVVMLDVDYFKQYNDSFGHPAGDDVLKLVSETLLASARVGDFVARYGGEEFVMILPDTDFAGSMVMAERCRRAIASKDWPNRAITVSVGVATISENSTPGALVKRADNGLYRAKALGRNRVATDEVGCATGAAA